MTDNSRQDMQTEPHKHVTYRTLGKSVVDEEGIHWMKEEPDKLNLNYYGNLGEAQKAIVYGSYVTLFLGVLIGILGLLSGNYMILLLELLDVVPFSIVGVRGAHAMEYRKPNAVFNCLVYSWVCTVSNAILVVLCLSVGIFLGLPFILWLVYGAVILCYLLFSDEVKTVYPKSLRSTTLLDKVLAVICILSTVIAFYGMATI